MTLMTELPMTSNNTVWRARFAAVAPTAAALASALAITLLGGCSTLLPPAPPAGTHAGTPAGPGTGALRGIPRGGAGPFRGIGHAAPGYGTRPAAAGFQRASEPGAVHAQRATDRHRHAADNRQRGGRRDRECRDRECLWRRARRQPGAGAPA